MDLKSISVNYKFSDPSDSLKTMDNLTFYSYYFNRTDIRFWFIPIRAYFT